MIRFFKIQNIHANKIFIYLIKEAVSPRAGCRVQVLIILRCFTMQRHCPHTQKLFEWWLMMILIVSTWNLQSVTSKLCFHNKLWHWSFSKKTWELGFGKPAWRLRTNCFELIDIVSCHLSQIPNKRNGNYSLPWQHYVLQNIQISRWTVQYTGLEMRVYNAVPSSEWRCWDSKRISRELEMSNIWSHISKIIITNILYVVLYIICNDHHHHHQICRDEQHLVIDLQHQLHGDHQSSTE